MSDTANATPAAATETAPEAAEPQTFTLDYVQQLRNEAAKHRTAKQAIENELKAQHDVALAAAKAEAEAKLSELQGESSSKDVAIEKLKAAFELNVPADKLDSFLGAVQGSTPDEVRESAKKLSELAGGFQPKAAGIPAFDPTQGQGAGSQPALNSNALLKSLTQKLGI